MGVLTVKADSSLHFQSCLRNDGQSRRVCLGTSGLFESAKETHFNPEVNFPGHAHRKKRYLEMSFQHSALTGTTLAFLFRGEDSPYPSRCAFPIRTTNSSFTDFVIGQNEVGGVALVKTPLCFNLIYLELSRVPSLVHTQI